MTWLDKLGVLMLHHQVLALLICSLLVLFILIACAEIFVRLFKSKPLDEGAYAILILLSVMLTLGGIQAIGEHFYEVKTFPVSEYSEEMDSQNGADSGRIVKYQQNGIQREQFVNSDSISLFESKTAKPSMAVLKKKVPKPQYRMANLPDLNQGRFNITDGDKLIIVKAKKVKWTKVTE